MPETWFTLRWPDGQDQRCYSPSTVIGQFLTPGTSYPLEELLTRVRDGLGRASERVAEKYGFACSSALAQLDEIETRAAPFQGQDAQVTCLAITL